jgi:hypothetical protein
MTVRGINLEAAFNKAVDATKESIDDVNTWLKDTFSIGNDIEDFDGFSIEAEKNDDGTYSLSADTSFTDGVSDYEIAEGTTFQDIENIKTYIDQNKTEIKKDYLKRVAEAKKNSTNLKSI